MTLTDENIEKELQITRNVYKQTQSLIDGMPTEGEGRRMQIKDMAEAVGLAVGMQPKEVLHMVNRYAHNAIGGYVTRGKKGGFIKGIKPLKVDKVATIQPTDSTMDVSDGIDSADEIDSEIES